MVALATDNAVFWLGELNGAYHHDKESQGRYGKGEGCIKGG
jgi:hypothetical protein